MNIGDVSKRSGVPAKTIRYYEDAGLVRPERSANGYRRFGQIHLHRLKLIGRARSLGFDIDTCRELMSLYDDSSRPAAEVRAVAKRRIEEMERKIAELQAVREALRHLAASCDGGERPECPVLHELSQDAGGDDGASSSRYRDDARG